MAGHEREVSSQGAEAWEGDMAGDWSTVGKRMIIRGCVLDIISELIVFILLHGNFEN